MTFKTKDNAARDARRGNPCGCPIPNVEGAHKGRPYGLPPSNAGDMGAPSPAVFATGVWASYGDRNVLSGLDLEVAAGSVVALAGPNGVGKSTLLKLIAGTLAPSRGTVSVLGRDVSRMTARERARLVAVVPQTPELPPGASALDVALMGRNPHLGLLSWESEEDVAIALDAMRQTGAAEFADRPVDRLSGGERQRVAVAMALAQQTPILLLDEPTANLDLAYQPAIMRLLRDVSGQGRAVIVAVHDLTLAAQFCDEIALLSNGRRIAAGAPWDVLTEDLIRQVYDADVLVLEHPKTGKPVVVGA